MLATRSTGKRRELHALCAELGIASEDLSMLGVREADAESGIEVHATFEENAMAKARWFARLLPGRVVLAEDSGLEVTALGGAPGVHSKLWAGLSSALSGAFLDAANGAALVRALERIDARRARYVCAAVCATVCTTGEESWSARGECAGQILRAPRGEGGFGYDPWFLSDELGRTFAEASPEEKATVSHRGRAVRALVRVLVRALPHEVLRSVRHKATE